MTTEPSRLCANTVPSERHPRVGMVVRYRESNVFITFVFGAFPLLSRRAYQMLLNSRTSGGIGLNLTDGRKNSEKSGEQEVGIELA